MSIAAINTVYTPGMGYSRTLKKGKAGEVSQCWGEEFAAKLKGQLAENAAQAAEAAKSAPPRPQLTDQDIKELAQKYNPGSMTRAQYDSFLEDLAEKGVLSKQEMGYLGYKGMIYIDVSDQGPRKVTAPDVDLSDPLAQKWMYGGYSMCGGLFRFDGTPNDNMDLLLSAKLHDLFTPKEDKAYYSYYSAMYDVVRRMNAIG